jgi:hypothetical protein
MRFDVVAERVVRDKKFAREVQEKALQALRDGVESQAWRELASYFASNDEELLLLIPPVERLKPGQFDPTTLTFMLSDSTAGTTNPTTTTTTTSRLCSLPTICKSDSEEVTGKASSSKGRTSKGASYKGAAKKRVRKS